MYLKINKGKNSQTNPTLPLQKTCLCFTISNFTHKPHETEAYVPQNDQQALWG